MTSFNEVTGVLDRTQFPDALLSDGSRSLTNNLSVATGITVDGVDISSFNSAYQAHLGNPLAHDYVRNILDDTNQPVERNSVNNDVRIYGSDGIAVLATEAGLRISGSGGGVGGGSGFGIKDVMGTGATPDGTGYISIVGSSVLGVIAGGNSVALSLIPGNIAHQDIGGRGKNDHHLAFIGLTVGATSVVPNGSDRILLAAGTNVSLTPSASTITIALSSTPTFTGLTVTGNLTITGTVDGVDVSVLSSDVSAIDASLDTLLIDFAAHQVVTSAHSAATVAHGATGAVVGTTNTQSLTNKTLVSPTFAPATATVPFTLSANGQGQTVVGLRADQLNKSVTAGNGLTGGGTLTGNISLAVGQGTGISVAATTVGVDTAHPFAWKADHSWTGKISFGSVTRQMIDLYSTTYAIGVQWSTAYIRTASRFSIHLGGTHSNSENDPGAGGTNLFTLTTSLITYKGSTIWHAANDGTGSGLDADLWDGNQFASFLNQAVRTTDSPTFAALTVNGLITATATGENMRLRYDANNYASFTVGTANLTLGVRGASSVIGSLTLDVENVLPLSALGTSLGSNIQKYLTLHAAELWVDTLVAQDKIATIGGRILVGSTTSLTRDLLAASTLMYVKHNGLANGDFVYLEGSGKIEFIQVNSAVTNMAEGDYRYTVVRSVDPTLAKDWYTGDAVFNTGTTNDGWIDMYAISSMVGASQTGPTIVGNVRTGTTWNLWEPRWAVGNLNGIYGYGAATYGAAFGSPTTTNVTIDNVNGFRVRKNGTTLMSSWDTSGNIVLGDTGFEHITISTTTIQIKDGANVYTSLTGGALSLGLTSTGDYVTIDGTNGVRIYNNATVSAHWKADGNLVIGEVANSKSRIEITSGAINIINRSADGADTTAISLSNSGSASFTGTITASAGSITGALTLGASGGIYQGTGTFASPTTGLKIWSDTSVGRIAGYNAGTIQWYAGTDGKLYAGTGNVMLDANGVTLISNTSDLFDAKKAIAWSHSSTNFFTMDGRRVASPAQTIGDIAVTESASSRSALLRIRAIGAGVTSNEPSVYISASRSYKHAYVNLVNTASGPTSTIGITGDSGTSFQVGEQTITATVTNAQRALFGTQGTILNGYVRGNQAGNSLRIDTGTGYIDIGARNTSWAHFYTDRANFYFDVPIHVNNSLSSYNTDLLLQRAGSTKLTLTSTGVTVAGIMTGTTSFEADTVYAGSSYSVLSGISNLGNSIYAQSTSSNHLVSIFSDGFSHIAAIAFGAYPVSPKPANSTYHFTGNMRYMGGQYLSVTQAGMFSFAGNGGKYFWLTSAGGLANHADVAWTEIMSVTASSLTVLGSITAPSITLTSNSYTSARFVATAVTTSGSVGLVPGTANDPGYVEWHRKNGTTRIGYMGWSTGGENNLAIVLENSAQLRVVGGNMGVNADPGSYRFRVNGNSYFEGDGTVTGILNVTGTLIVPKGGTVSTPAIYFDTDVNTGFYRWGTDSWSLVAGGVSMISLTPTSIDLKEELSDWVSLTLASGWTNYGGAFSTAQYKRVGDLVFLRGLVTSTSWNTYPILATMPSGFRPLLQAMFVCAGSTSGSSVRIDVEASGGLRWVGGGGGTAWISLDGIVFSIK